MADTTTLPRLRLAALAAAMLLAHSAFGASLTLDARPRSVELGEAVTLTLSLRNAARAAKPEITLPGGVRIVSEGGATHTPRIMNGRVTRSVDYSYTLAFDGTGSYTLGPARVRLSRGVLTSGTAAVTVGEAGASRDVLVFAGLAPARAYVGQPVVATFACAEAREVSGRRIVVPFLQDIPGLRIDEPEKLKDRWIDSVNRTRRGLAGYDVLDVSSPQGQVVARVGRREIDGVPYVVRTVRRVLLPQEPGRHDLGTASAAASIVVGYRQARDPFGGAPFGGGIFGRRAVTRTVSVS